jgi:protein arginine N-methyltransferase 1
MLARLNWNDRYTVPRSLVFQIGGAGVLMVRSSLSRPALTLPPDRLRLLLAFAAGETPTRVLAGLRNQPPPAEKGFAGAVGELIAGHVLVPAGDRPPEPQPARGFGSAVTQYSMVADRVRVESYRRAIFARCRGRLVAEIGCGSGILSIFAAQAGARRVVAIEESGIADVAEAMFRANGVADRVELRRANSLDVTIEPRAEVIVHELLGSDPFVENMLRFIEDARERLLAPGGRLIPYAIDVCCVGFEVDDRPWFDVERAFAELAELERLYGIDFGAYREAIARAAPTVRRRPLGDVGRERFLPAVLTEETRLFHLDLRPGSSLAVEPRDDLRLRVTRQGKLGAVLVYFRAHLDEETVLSTAPDAPWTPNWPRDARPLERVIAVEPGRQIPIRAEVRTAHGLENLHVELA